MGATAPPSSTDVVIEIPSMRPCPSFCSSGMPITVNVGAAAPDSGSWCQSPPSTQHQQQQAQPQPVIAPCAAHTCMTRTPGGSSGKSHGSCRIRRMLTTGLPQACLQVLTHSLHGAAVSSLPAGPHIHCEEQCGEGQRRDPAEASHSVLSAPPDVSTGGWYVFAHAHHGSRRVVGLQPHLHNYAKS